MPDLLRIGNAQGFWGDSIDAAARLVDQQPDLDYLTLDYLSEVSLSIMALQRRRDPSTGYARDFVDIVRRLTPAWKKGSPVKVITNAGGLDSVACARACATALREAGLKGKRIGVVAGDDCLDLLRSAPNRPEFRNLDTGESLARVGPLLETANAYLGAAPLVEALARGADLVVAGRVADPSLAVAPCIHRFGWSHDDWNKIAQATIAGHLLECGTQVTGGISTGWMDVPDPADIGFPVVEIDLQGEIVVSKPPGTGGRVDRLTVTEQLLYELVDPGAYLSPDATVSFLTIVLEELGGDRVRVTGASGGPATDFFKVSATYREGYRASGMLTIVGRDCVAKARRSGEIIRQRLRAAGAKPAEFSIECIGAGDATGGIIRGVRDEELFETVLRLGARDSDKAVVERFTKELAPLVTSGAQGTTGYAGGRPSVQPVFGYWPCLVPKKHICPTAEIVEV